MVLEKVEAEEEFVLDGAKKARLQVKCAQFEVGNCIHRRLPFLSFVICQRSALWFKTA